MKPNPASAADALARLVRMTRPRGRVRGEAGRGARGQHRFELSHRPRDLPEGTTLLAFVDHDTLSVRALSEGEGATLRQQFRRTDLTAAEQVALGKGGATGAEIALGPTLMTLAHRQSDARYQALLDRSLSVPEAARRLRVGGSRIRQMLGERSIYGLKRGGDWRLPAFQFAPSRGGLVPGIGMVVRALPKSAAPLAVENWFRTPNPDLGEGREDEKPETPLQWLRQGRDPEALVPLAAAL